MRVSTLDFSSSAAFSAMSLRRLPSKLNGFVTTPIVSAPASFASSATTGAAPEPVPPPMPAVMKTMSESASASPILSRSSSAARAPIALSPPAPRPRVILSPMRILWGASDWRSAWASVLQAMNSTPIISARIIRLTALLPPPPTPMTRMRAKFSESDRNGIGNAPRAMALDGGDESLCRAGAVTGMGASGLQRKCGVYPRPQADRLVRFAGGATGHRSAEPPPLPGQERQADGPHGVVGVGVEERDRLPRPQREVATQHRHGHRRRGEERQDVVRTVAGRSVTMTPSIVPRQQPVERRHRVVVGPRAELEDHDGGGRVRHEHGQQAVPALGGVPEERA